MVSPDSKNRAVELASRYPASREILEFYAGLFGNDVDWTTLQKHLGQTAPGPLRDLADTDQPVDLFLRILGKLPKRLPEAANECPACGQLPQCAALRPEGDGSAMFLVCSQCAAEWIFTRSQCPLCLDCDEARRSYYAAEEFPHIQTMLCEACQGYVHIIHCGKDGQAIPIVDELACTPLDIWARQQGYTKAMPNLAGI